MDAERWRRIEEIFHGAVERDAASREGYLAEACAGDELLRREVDALLRGDTEAADFIESPAAAALPELAREEAPKLAPGERLGPYEVTGLIGRGGMGEVYRARDTRLGRDVAIKVLPALVAADPERLRRMELEARSAGRLNHPNVLSLYDTGLHDGSPYLVTELLTGRTLREVLDRQSLPPRKAFEVAVQMARGLAAAHEKGIVHRDLKPENVYVTGDGQVKLLDFGLAKLAPTEGPEALSRTLTRPAATAPGIVVGTVGYMSPEQVRGGAVDHRSDVFSFGCILYEMLTGRRAFQGDSAVETMHAILKDDPPELASGLRVALPAERILRRCLEKEPEERFQSARDLAFALEALSAPSGVEESARPATKPRRAVPVAALLAAIVLAAAGGALVASRLARTAQPVFRRVTYRRGTIGSARFSPDGQTVVYAAAFAGAPPELYATRLGSPEARGFGLAGAEVLAISAQGEMAVRLPKEYTLARMPLLGGVPRELSKSIAFADWSPDGASLAVVRHEPVRQVLEYPLGTALYSTANELSSARVSPDGRSVAVLERGRFDMRSRVLLVDGPGKARVLAEDGGYEGGAGWTSSGEVLYTSDDLAVSTTLKAVKPGGKPRSLATFDGHVRLADADRGGRALLVRDDIRTQVFFRGPGDLAERDLSWLDSSFAADLSDDGARLLLVEDGAGGGPTRAVYLRGTDGSPAVRLGDGGALDLSPDGTQALVLKPGSTSELWSVPTGAGDAVPIPTAPLASVRMAAFFPDGKRVVLAGAEQGHDIRVYVTEARAGAPPPRPITPERSSLPMGCKPVSPDGAWVAAQTAGHVVLYPVGGGEPRSLSVPPRDEPLRFNADGRLLYTRRRGLPTRLFAVDLASGRAEPWKELMPGDPVGVGAVRSVVLTPDGASYAYTAERTLSELLMMELR